MKRGANKHSPRRQRMRVAEPVCVAVSPTFAAMLVVVAAAGGVYAVATTTARNVAGRFASEPAASHARQLAFAVAVRRASSDEREARAKCDQLARSARRPCDVLAAADAKRYIRDALGPPHPDEQASAGDAARRRW